MPLTGRRTLSFLAILVAAATVFVIRSRRTAQSDTAFRLEWVATAHQFGPVGYRDPAGAISPDGRWIAYSEGRFLRVRSVLGGPLVDLPPGEAQIRNLAWNSDSRTIAADGYQAQGGWALYDRVAGTRRALWPDPLTGTIGDTKETTSARGADFRQVAFSADGRSVAAIVNARDGQELWTMGVDGGSTRVERMTHRIAFPAWTPDGQVACIATVDGRPRVTLPCGGLTIETEPDLDVHGPIAFASGRVWLSMPNEAGTVDLWSAPANGGRARRLTSFSRDTYAPSVAVDGTVMFKVQSYRTVVAVASAHGGPAQPLATFQSETPSWDPTGRWIGITYGTWRRVVDDAHYPDIAQDAGIIAANPMHPAASPSSVTHASASEDQSLCWSPNGKWIAFHSHKDLSDDIWLRPAVGETPPRRVSVLGRGAETGWPRWSPDGHWLLFDGADRSTHRSVMYVVGMDQETGATTSEAREIAVRGIDGEVSHAEWLPDSAHVIALAKEAPGRHVIFTTARDGGDATVVHRFASEHDAPGLAVSPDGHDLAFVAPAADGFFQIFRLPVAGGAPAPITNDPSHKTQPAWSPDGLRIACTVWNYDVQFWVLRANRS